MQFNLNDKLKAEALAKDYQPRQFIQVRDLLPTSQALELHQCLSKEIPWGLFYFKDGTGERIAPEDFEKLQHEEKQKIYQHIFQSARHDYQFMFHYFPIMKSIQEGIQPDFPLHKWLGFLNSAPMLEFVKKVTGIQEIVRADAMATKFVGNCFLHKHLDHQDGKTRRIAYVMNLTEKWDMNWGGYLQIFDDKMNVEHAFKPTFNALNMFTVPKDHAVNTVPPYCPGERLSLTGWFHEG